MTTKIEDYWTTKGKS